MADEQKPKNRIRVVLPGVVELEVESGSETLDKCFELANTIALHAGVGQGLNGETFDERKKRHGIE